MRSRSRYQFVPANKPQNMFCMKDNRKYFDKDFKLLFRDSKSCEIIKLIESHAINSTIQDLTASSGETLLHLAAKYGIAKIVSYLISNGCEVDARNSNCGWTPLMISASYCDTNVCKLLLDAGADIFATDHLGESALYASVNYSDPAFDSTYHTRDLFFNTLESLQLSKEELALKFIESRCPLYYIIQLNDTELTMMLRERGYTIPKCFSKDDNLLHDAVVKQNLENMTFVLELTDPDINALDFDSSYSPIHHAVETGDINGNVSIIKFLLDKGADINVRGMNGMTPLCAIFNGFMTIEQKKYCMYFLLQHGADPQIIDNYGDTAIDYALDSVEENYDETLLDPLLSHLALQEALGVPIIEELREQIDEEQNLKIYFDSCKRCLAEMKKITISGQITLYKVLTESEQQVIEYMRDPQVVSSFMHTMFDTNFYYRYIMKKKFIEAIDNIKREKIKHSV